MMERRRPAAVELGGFQVGFDWSGPPSRAIPDRARRNLAFVPCACWRTMDLRRLNTRSGGVTWPVD
jgi:hypothetical protein